MKDTFAVFKKMNFTKVFLAAITSRLGTIVGMTAFTFYLLDRFSSQPFYATFTEMMYSAPTLLVFFLTGVVADRMDRQKVAYYSDFICAGLSIVLIGAIMTEFMPFVFLVLFLRSAVAKFFAPAEMSLVQGILDEEEYSTAAGLNQMVAGVFNLFATALGLGAYWALGVHGAIIGDAVTFLISAILIMSCTIHEEARLPNGSHRIKDLNFSFIFKEFKDGLLYILNHKLLMALIAGFFILGIVNGGLSVMPLYVLKYKLTPDDYEQWAVVLGIIFGVFMITGSILASIVAKKLKLYTCLSLGLGIAGIFLVASGLVPTVTWFLILTAFVALTIPLANIAIGGWLPSIVDRKMMGRVESWITPVMMISHTATLGIISIGFPKYFSISSLFYFCGAVLALVGILYYLILPKLSNDFDERKSVEKEQPAPVSL
ncbi:MFS transporter [Pontibacillus marinus]|uniref:MFS transporter n=1 Tax=Pontibacillus marinus BH030004 = DSM 16465 TaxID=1385511 RepID=A0A0A5FWA2_9BACI|nr:MFS transporter [Pontibacillus marinus]KGX84194.1 MFS transporter [Pontibacillus marinus BH030004 = DSM 16465]